MKTLAFNKESKNLILQLFGKAIDEQGFIFDIKTGTRVLNPQGEEVLACDFAGIRKGSEIFITKDLPSLIQFASDTES
jgi:hypothetical protein